MPSIFTTLAEAQAELSRRRRDRVLEQKVADYLGSDVPEVLRKNPALVLFRHIATANGETERLLALAETMRLLPAWLEFADDRFYSFNPDKYALLAPQFFLGRKPDGEDDIGKIRLADAAIVQGKSFADIATKWGENLVEFHHQVLFSRHPELRDRVEDVSAWLNHHGVRAAKFYEQFLALFIRHGVLAEYFEAKSSEEKFLREVFLPAFEKVHARFGLRPLIIRLDPPEAGSDAWCLGSAEAKAATEQRIAELKQGAVVAENGIA